MKKIIAILLSTLFISSVYAAAGDKVFVMGTSTVTGWPINSLTGDSIKPQNEWHVRIFADGIAADIGGAIGAVLVGVNDCTHDGPVNVMCYNGYPACMTNQISVCDVAVGGALVNDLAGGVLASYICKEVSGSCVAGSQSVKMAGQISIRETSDPGTVKAVIMGYAFEHHDYLWQPEFLADSVASYEWWKTGMSTVMAEVDAARTTHNSDIILLMTGDGWGGTANSPVAENYGDRYWVYNVHDIIDLDEPWNRWGLHSELHEFIRVESATYGWIMVDEFGRFSHDEAWRWSERTYLTTEAAGVYEQEGLSAHHNVWGERWLGRRELNAYLILTGAADTDGDGIVDTMEDTIGSDDTKADTDGDGCDDGVEWDAGGGTVFGGGWAVFGGNRDPTNPNDFFDVNGDQRVDRKDINILTRAVVLGIPDRGFNATLMREPPVEYSVVGMDPNQSDFWDTQAAVAGQAYPFNGPSYRDLVLMYRQLGHRCDCLPDYSNCKLATGEICQQDEQCLTNLCGCDGSGLKDRQCLDVNTVYGRSVDARQCSNLGANRYCVNNADCASNVCSDKFVEGMMACVGN